MVMITTWYEMIKSECESNGDDVSDLECTLNYERMHKEFDNGYGGAEGQSFTAWSTRFVYFPVCYDGAEWVGSVPRNPCDIATDHQGGW